MFSGTSEWAGRTFSWRRAMPVGASLTDAAPLLVALHGGTYDSGYFDVVGHSLLAHAAALGIEILALDRPGYGDTKALDASELTHAGNAAILDAALPDIWAREGNGRAGIVLIGHAIGAAIALRTPHAGQAGRY